MPYYKCTMLFECGKNGWSESWYHQDEGPRDAEGFLRNLCQDRRALLGTGAFIIAYRISNVTNDRDALLVPYDGFALNPGAAAGVADSSWQAFLIRTEASSAHRKSWFTRGQPDAWIERAADGRIPVPGDLQTGITAMKLRLMTSLWRIQAWRNESDPDTVERPIIKVNDDAGKVQLDVPGHNFSVGSIVHVRKSRWSATIGGINGNHLVIKVDNALVTLQLPILVGSYLGGGLARLREYTYPIVSEMEAMRAGKRDTGRPFFLTRGRAAKK